MAAGGFKFGQASATYNSSTYTTKRAWALDVHRARCDAFFLAQHREGIGAGGNTWFSLQTELYNEIGESRTVGGETYTLYIQDIHPLSTDTTGDYPAFASYWRRYGENTLYCIITSNGVNNQSTYSTNYQRGLYIPLNKMPNTGSSANSRYVFSSLAHSYGNNGISSVDLSNDSGLTEQQLPILPLCGFSGNTKSNSYTVNDNTSVIYNPTQGVTYSFGYAIRGHVIECFYRTSEYTSNSGWNWSIIGEILSNGESGYNTAFYTYYNNGNEKTIIDSNYYPRYSNQSCAFACINNEELVFPPSVLNTNVTRYPKLSPSFMPCRCNTTMPSELLFSAGCLSFCQQTGSLYSESNGGIDGYGNCVAGLINTDILRIVARQACTVGGATYQSGNFVCPLNQVGTINSDDFGILLGWDTSNESIV